MMEAQINSRTISQIENVRCEIARGEAFASTNDNIKGNEVYHVLTFLH